MTNNSTNNPEYNRNNPTTNEGSIDFDTNGRHTEKQVIQETKEGMENLTDSTINYSLSNAGTKSDLLIQQTGLKYERDIRNIDGFLPTLDKLLEEIKQTKKGISKRGQTKAGKRSMELAKSKLKQYEEQIKNKKKILKKQIKKNITPEIYESDINQVKKIKLEVDTIRHDISVGQRGELSNQGAFLYNSPENAKKANKKQEKLIDFEKKMESVLEDGAIKKIFSDNKQNTINFYRRFAEGNYTPEDLQIFLFHSNTFTPSFQRCGISIPTQINNPGNGRIIQINNPGNGRTIQTIEGNTNKQSNYKNMGRGEAFEKGGVSGLLDKVLSNCSNMTPGQKDTWKTLGVIGGIAAGIFGLYKFYTNKNRSIRTKAGITAATIFGTEFLLGKNPASLYTELLAGGLSIDELKNKFGNITGCLRNSGSKSNETTSGSNGENSTETISEAVVPAMYSMMIFNSNTKVRDINEMTNNFKSDEQNQNRNIFYQESCNKLKKQYGQEATEAFQNTFSNKFDEQKRKERLASFGVTENTKQSESIYGLSNNAIMNKTLLEKYKADNGLKEIGNDGLKTYVDNKRINKQAIDFDDLDEHKDERFATNTEATNTERPIDIENKTTLVNQVESLSLNKDKKEELKQAIQDFYDIRNISNKPNFSLKFKDNLLILISHDGNETKIDLETNTLKSKNNIDIRFETLTEALNIADLTNDILYITNNKTLASHPIKQQPFQYQRSQKAICFNDAKLWSFDLDTRIKSINWLRDRSSIDKNASTYANYLSERRKETNKLNLTQYPLVKQLGIDFYSDENEIKRLEKRLEIIKNTLKNSKNRKDTKTPFSIETRTHKLKFKGNGALNNPQTIKFPEDVFKEFPTLESNEENFINAMNNPDNGMYIKF